MASLSGPQDNKLRRLFSENISVDVERIVEAVAAQCNPEDVFPIKELCEWAEENGYIKETEQ